MKREHDRLAALMANFGSPNVVAEIDQALAEIEQERQEILEFRKMAVRRHGEGGTQPDVNLSLTVVDLIRRYQNDDKSGFGGLQYRTRINYAGILRRMENDIGPEKVADLTEERIKSAFEDWSGRGERVAMARSFIALLRILAAYGATVLKSRDCRELKLTLHEMRFETVPKRTERLHLDDVVKIIANAHERQLHSIALAQAIQYEFGLKQKDTVGEWVPVTEEGESDIIDERLKEKWVKGIRWEELGSDLTLRHVASFDGSLIEKPFGQSKLVMDQLEYLRSSAGEFPKKGPIITDGDRPYRLHKFRRLWRELADAAGIPKGIYNMDTI